MKNHLRIGGLALLLGLPGLFPLSLAASILNFPRISFEAGNLTGVAIVNPSNQDAQVTLSVYGENGSLVSAAGFTNPVKPNGFLPATDRTRVSG